MQTSRRAIEGMVPHAISHATDSDAALLAARQAGRDHWVMAVASRVRALGAALRRGSVYAQLSSLTDRELADIGLTRGEIRSVYDAEFCARRVLRSRA